MEVLRLVHNDGVEALVGEPIQRLEKKGRRLFAPERLRVRAGGRIGQGSPADLDNASHSEWNVDTVKPSARGLRYAARPRL